MNYHAQQRELRAIDDRTHAANERAEFAKRHPEYAVVRGSQVVAESASQAYRDHCVWQARAVDPDESERIYQQALAREQGAVYFEGM